MNEVRHVDADIYIQILATSPFISINTIRKGVDELLSNPKFDSAVLIKKDQQYLWGDSKPTYDINNIPNSVDLPTSIIETMGLYIVRREAAQHTKRRIGDMPFLI
jgi:hypothetical protein